MAEETRFPITEQPVWEDECQAQAPDVVRNSPRGQGPRSHHRLQGRQLWGPLDDATGLGTGRCPTNSWQHTSQSLPRPRPTALPASLLAGEAMPTSLPRPQGRAQDPRVLPPCTRPPFPTAYVAFRGPEQWLPGHGPGAGGGCRRPGSSAPGDCRQDRVRVPAPLTPPARPGQGVRAGHRETATLWPPDWHATRSRGPGRSLTPLPALHNMNPGPYQSCSFRIPAARGPACVGLRRLRACAAVSHRPGSELSTGELQRRPQKPALLPRPAHTTPKGQLCPWRWACPTQDRRSFPVCRLSDPLRGSPDSRQPS